MAMVNERSKSLARHRKLDISATKVFFYLLLQVCKCAFCTIKLSDELLQTNCCFGEIISSFWLVCFSICMNNWTVSIGFTFVCVSVSLFIFNLWSSISTLTVFVGFVSIPSTNSQPIRTHSHTFSQFSYFGEFARYIPMEWKYHISYQHFLFIQISGCELFCVTHSAQTGTMVQIDIELIRMELDSSPVVVQFECTYPNPIVSRAHRVWASSRLVYGECVCPCGVYALHHPYISNDDVCSPRAISTNFEAIHGTMQRRLLVVFSNALINSAGATKCISHRGLSEKLCLSMKIYGCRWRNTVKKIPKMCPFPAFSVLSYVIHKWLVIAWWIYPCW